MFVGEIEDPHSPTTPWQTAGNYSPDSNGCFGDSHGGR